MKKTKKEILLEEHLRKIMHRVDYVINESPRYQRLIGVDEEFDEIPQLTSEAGEQEDAPIQGGGEVPPAPSNDQPVGMDVPPAGEEVPPVDNMPTDGMPTDVPPEAGDQSGTDVNAPMGGMGTPNAGQEVDNIQNEIIKHNIAAMQSIHDQLEGLNNTVKGLNTKLETLNAEVEEVREPTNSEKLMSKTNVSYPYYFNLNDFWSGNWFNEKREEEKTKGIRELPDGTFIADFDDLPQQSKMDVQNSFNQF